MAQLPPKIPSMTQNWHSSSHQRMPINMSNFVPTNNNTSTSMPTAQQQQQPTWVDEFLDFSSARRGAHRRSMSDSIAFLETAPFIGVECRNNGTSGGFERLDDDQLMSMFSDEVLVALPPTVSSSNASTPSDHNSNIDDENKPIMPLDQQPKSEPGEVESSCKPEPQDPVLPSTTTTGDSNVDPKRVKRILANRQSAQRSRVRKLQYISELERSVTTLQTEVSSLSPRVAFLDHQRLILNVDNSALKQRIAALAQDNIFKDAHQEALKKEIERLRQIYHHQNLKKMSSAANLQNAPPPSSPSQAPQPPTPDHFGGTDKERLVN
ncbi:basic leucine zipper 61-like [Juglans microcarpa x Juglans regia]|uniref:basic leucine zipper 61-like n=1 Tax=Juglans microcarpa x Juglans regia TaxID=2249226 RepID=UPI001B7F3257|nr:basic leucine zipper 61-like [Juglans microcarpa x Juglans regia]